MMQKKYTFQLNNTMYKMFKKVGPKSLISKYIQTNLNLKCIPEQTIKKQTFFFFFKEQIVCSLIQLGSKSKSLLQSKQFQIHEFK